MRGSRVVAMLGGTAILLFAAPAGAHVPHTVAPGETLWSIAYRNGFTTRSLAAANGLSPEAQVVLGSTVYIPTVPEAASALGGGSPVAGVPGTRSGAGSGGGASGLASGSAAPPPAGAYVVKPGETLSGIAARSGVSTGAVAAMNGLDPAAHLLAGTTLKLPTTAAPARSPQATSSPAPQVVPKAAPAATGGSVGAQEIGQVAGQHGVPASLAAAVAWQESGFNNNAVSSANARGVMQVLPGTWQWVQQNLADRQLDPASPQDNVRAGVLYLRQLLRDSGGDVPTAVASYYQGGASVRRIGMLPETQRYVQNVIALRGRFGG